MFAVDAVGKKGGLILMWEDSLEVTVRSYSVGHIDCYVKEEGGRRWRFTGFYGNPVTEQRKFSWDLLRKLSEQDEMGEWAWLVGGDLNEIIDDGEKKGGRPRPLSQMNMLRETLLYCNLHEVAYPDKSMTWSNNRPEGLIFERLDRFLGNTKWAIEFPNASTQTLDFFGSDHRPIFCNLLDEERVLKRKGKGRFHFEDKWFTDNNFVPDFLCEWAELRQGRDMMETLGRCEEFLKKWSGKRWDKLGKQVAEMRKKRQEMMGEKGSKWSDEDFLKISRQIEETVEAEAEH